MTTGGDDDSILDFLPDQAALVDASGVIVRTNVAWRTFAAENGGDPLRTGLGVSYLDACRTALGDSEDGALARGALAALLAGQRDNAALEYPCHSPTEQRWFLMRAQRMPSGALLVTHTDITRRKLAEMRAEALASRDELTGVLNRRGLTERLQLELSRTERHGLVLSAILLDCDDFKDVNARHGHAVGDAVLAELARRLCDSVRADDTVGRVGGDEFVLLLADTAFTKALYAAERVRMRVASSPLAMSPAGPVNVTASLSVAELGPTTQTLDDVLRACRIGLDASKGTGKNRVATSHAPRPVIERLVNAPLHVAHQPIVALATGEPIAVELLTRPPEDLGGPATYLRLAAEQGVLRAVDQACLAACFATAARLPAGARAHVNVLPSTVLALRRADWEALAPTPELRGRICLELGEHEILGDATNLVPHLGALRALGFTLALDDVGFGRSCLEHLVVLEPEVVKIDRRFVHRVAESPVRERQLERLVRLTHTLGARAVVEGVEREVDARVAARVGADAGQGFLWGEPASVAADGA